ncbi:homoserine kinase [Candidatus Aerophobetes bacterium]|nr:homoserine kinase [Candidatus Aerophobetes bacterium]
MPKVKVTVPASCANIGCGFDCLGLALSLYNTIEVEMVREAGIFIEVEGEGKGIIPTSTENIIIPALKLIFDKTGEKLQGIRIRQINRIPLEKGLGSSAATRIGGIVAANYLLKANLSTAQILKMAATLEGHLDNAAASLLGGFIAVANFKDVPVWVKLTISDKLKVVLAVPEVKIATNKARSILPDRIPFAHAVFNLSRLAILIPSLSYGLWSNLSLATQDKLHQPYRASLLPGMDEVFEAALNEGAKGVFLSGSGSGIAAFSFEQDAGKIGEVMQKAFLKKKIQAQVFILSVAKEGCKVNETQ